MRFFIILVNHYTISNINYLIVYIFIYLLNSICFNYRNKKHNNDYSSFYNNIELSYEKIYMPNLTYKFYKFIIITISDPRNVAKRYIQRLYKDKYSRDLLFIYVIGDGRCKNFICYESKWFNDILYIHIKNNYFNLTTLFLVALKWINKKIKYDYIMKWDDDIIINIPLLYIFINIQMNIVQYCGYLYNATSICRKKNRICYIPFFRYRYTYLPPFIASGVLILNHNASQSIDNYHTKFKSYLIRDDQYIGVIYNILAIKPSSLSKYYIRCITNSKKIKLYNFLSYHTNNDFELYFLYKKLFYK